jgi:hypothetical protein
VGGPSFFLAWTPAGKKKIADTIRARHAGRDRRCLIIAEMLDAEIINAEIINAEIIDPEIMAAEVVDVEFIEFGAAGH